MEDRDLQTFATNYTPNDFERIKFDWNGKHGDKFYDPNYTFRNQVCEFIIPQIENVKLDLIRDLYLELSKSSKETWGVYTNYHLFAQELLLRGGSTYILDYLEGAIQSFDTRLASEPIKLSKQSIQEILDFIKEKLSTETSESNISILKFGEDRFEKAFHAI